MNRNRHLSAYADDVRRRVLLLMLTMGALGASAATLSHALEAGTPLFSRVLPPLTLVVSIVLLYSLWFYPRTFPIVRTAALIYMPAFAAAATPASCPARWTRTPRASLSSISKT